MSTLRRATSSTAAAGGPPGAARPASRGRSPGARPVRAALAPHLLALVPVLLVLGWAWAPVLALPFTGEDYTLLASARRGAAVYPHVFRPWSGLLLRGLHALAGVDSPVPYHAVSLGLHALNATLVYALGLALLGRRSLAALAALAFAAGAGATDALAWIAAVNRPLSAAGALLALNGLARLGRSPRGAPALVILVLGGLLLQFGANEEFYGTALLVAAWCAGLAWRVPATRRTSLALALAAAGGIALHYLVFHRVPGGAERVLAGGAGAAFASAARRTDELLSGWGIEAHLPYLPFVLAGVALLAVGPRAALLLLLAWLASLVPFALSDAVGYRAYPSQAPLALLLAAAAAELVPGRRPWAAPATAVVLGLVALLAAHAPREERLARWRAALAEIDACRPDAVRMARLAPDVPPTLVNLETTTAMLFAYHFGLEPSEVQHVGFLDAATGYVPPVHDPPEPWYGRRCEGSLGPIERDAYFASRPALEPLRLYERVLTVASLEEARRRLADGSADVTREVLAEAPPELFAALGGGPVEAPAGSVELLEPLAFDPGSREATMRVRVRTPRPAVLAYLDEVLYRDLMRISLDQTIFSGVRETRVIELQARRAGSRERLPAFHVDAYGLGVLVPAGEHELALLFTVRAPEELR